VRVTISVTGRVTKAIAISGHPLLRDAAVDAARRWVFEPTMVDGNPVETELVLTFDFAAPPPS
jgi:protein TonB